MRPLLQETIGFNIGALPVNDVREFDISDLNEKTASTPAYPITTYSKEQCPKTDEDKRAMKDTPYLQALGSLIFYLSVSTRPDISQAVSVLAQYASNPGKDHWKSITRIMKYLLGTAGFGLTL